MTDIDQHKERRMTDHQDTREEIDEIKTIVTKLRIEKQDKIPITIIAGILLYALALPFFAGQWMATMSIRQETMMGQLKDGVNDRFRGTDAYREFQLRDQRLDYMDKRVDDKSASLMKLFRMHDNLESRVDKLEIESNIKLHDKNGRGNP